MEVDTGIIYCWRNIHNGKRYIGQTVNPKARFNYHRRHLGNYNGPNHFYRAMNKYSSMDDWEYYVIEEVPTSQLDTQEIYWIAFYDSMNPECGYNSREGGHNSYGYKRPEEIHRKISESRKGQKLSLEHRKKISASHKGKKHSEETCRKISESHKGKHSPLKGKKFSEETCRKISESHKGKKFSEETCRKISEAKKGRKYTPKVCKNMSNAHNPNRIAIYQNDTLITICDTLKEAACLTGVSHTCVQQIVSGRYLQTRSGYSFKYISKSS